MSGMKCQMWTKAIWASHHRRSPFHRRVGPRLLLRRLPQLLRRAQAIQVGRSTRRVKKAMHHPPSYRDPVTGQAVRAQTVLQRQNRREVHHRHSPRQWDSSHFLIAPRPPRSPLPQIKPCRADRPPLDRYGRPDHHHPCQQSTLPRPAVQSHLTPKRYRGRMGRGIAAIRPVPSVMLGRKT